MGKLLYIEASPRKEPTLGGGEAGEKAAEAANARAQELGKVS